MLIISRTTGTRIIIGDREIVITVKKIQKNRRVVLGIEAPKDVKIKLVGEPSDPPDNSGNR